MSDDDFLKINSPSATSPDESGSGAAAATEDVTNQDNGAAADQGANPGSAASASDDNTNNGDAGDPDQSGGDDSASGSDDQGDPAAGSEDQNKSADGSQSPASNAEANADADKPGDKKDDQAQEPAKAEGDKTKTDGEGTKSEEKPVDYEAFFKQVMTPFKANGRMIELKTPEEAIRLMQMGAGYGRKIQDLQPHLKVLRMLEKNELLDEGKLSFLIDINQKNPDAIKKIIKDSGIDPLDLNIGDNVSYSPNNHAVSDQEVAFTQALKDLQDAETGQETLRTINQTWDKESKSLLWEQPQILQVIQTQRENGLYDQIAAEVDRQKLLGTIPANTPFLQAYKAAGDHLVATNGFKPVEGANPPGQAPQIQTQQNSGSQPQVIATRTAAPKPQVSNGDKAAAASLTKTTTTRRGTATVNPLEMADDDFMKQFANRL